ncbi:hypothetical protein [Sphingomonas sanxanigenens]|uniref:Uncharacterized protein n=1 Tax=Sphingomonas sanxanigenens DSM 19645 = NX02 TaxID=1123269 RepID=W0A8L4_9SPHN|nr:hypothetical protein [Sphingomonas sanxanigenens]AHE52832.1 hypothetical protein NX02_05465 [Sphingomonas sanxanigenens DSM 19645 = NX02]
MNSVDKIYSKMERALRNRTGAKFTLDELLVMADLGILEKVLIASAQALVADCRASRDAKAGENARPVQPNAG